MADGRILHLSPVIEVHPDGSSSHVGSEPDARLVKLAGAFVEVDSITDPVRRVVRAQQLFGKASVTLFAHDPWPGLSATALAKAFERAPGHPGAERRAVRRRPDEGLTSKENSMTWIKIQPDHDPATDPPETGASFEIASPPSHGLHTTRCRCDGRAVVPGPMGKAMPCPCPGCPAPAPTETVTSDSVALAGLSGDLRDAIEACARHVRSHCDRPYEQGDRLLRALGVRP